MNKLNEPARWTSQTDQLDRPAGRTIWTDQLDGPAGQTSWTNQLDRPPKQTQLNRPAGQTSWTDQFFLFEAMASLHVRRLIFQFVHCPSFRVRWRPCFYLINRMEKMGQQFFLAQLKNILIVRYLFKKIVYPKNNCGIKYWFLKFKTSVLNTNARRTNVAWKNVWVIHLN